MLAHRAREPGAKLFLSYLPDGRRYSYADLHALSDRVDRPWRS